MRHTAALTLAVFSALSFQAWRALAGDVRGAFRLKHQEYCVGEPILVEFSVTNDTETEYSFSVGGDYRGNFRDMRFSFQVNDKTDRPFNQKLLDNWGVGLGGTTTLKPGETYVSDQLLNVWVHLLPPGEYNVRCERKLARDSYGKTGDRQELPAPVTIGAEMSCRVVQYDRERIVESIRRMKMTRRSESKGVKRFLVGSSVGWALKDLSNKFQSGVAPGTNVPDFMEAVLSKLPTHWEDRYYLEYDLRANRNWLTAANPEEFRLTFVVRNNSNKTRSHNLTSSALSVGGENLQAWFHILKGMMQKAELSDTIKPAQVIEISARLNEFLTTGDEQELVWRVGTFAETVKVHLRR